MPEPEQLHILVDTAVRIDAQKTPRTLVDALRRHFRQHAARDSSTTLMDTRLMDTHEGQHRMPQGLLPKVTETCRRHGVPFAVEDRRAMVSCPPLRSTTSLSKAEQELLRQLLLRDGGVLIAAADQSHPLAIELITRRQQHTLIVVETAQEERRWLDRLQRVLKLSAPFVLPITEATSETHIVVGRYSAMAKLPSSTLKDGYGMVVFDGISQVNALTLFKSIRAVGARYLLGLAQRPERADGLHHQLFMTLGGTQHHLAPTETPRLQISYRNRVTSFAYPYEGRRQYQAMIADLARDRERAALILEDVMAQATAGHSCLVLSERREHLELMASLVPPECSAEILTSTVRLAERGRIISRFQNRETTVLMATTQIVGEALSTPTHDRLFLAFPFSYTRKLDKAIAGLLQPQADQADAIIFDYDDPAVVPLHRAFLKRKHFFTKLSKKTREQQLQHAQLALPLDPL